jgi:hypothetical protein
MRKSNTFVMVVLLGAAACGVEPSDDSAETGSEVTMQSEISQPDGSTVVKWGSSDTVAAAALQSCRIQLTGYPTEGQIHLDPGGTLPQPITHPSGVQTTWLHRGTRFEKGDYASIGKACLVFQSDGNLVVYDEHQAARWASDTNGRGAVAKFQTDGNLVVYDAAGQPVRTGRSPSNTCCNAWDLHVQADGNVVIYDVWTPKWTTNTAH